MRKLLIFLIMSVSIMTSSTSFARVLGNILVEGIDSRTAKLVQEEIQGQLKSGFTLDDIQETLASIYGMGTFNGIEVFFEEHDTKTDLVFKITPVRYIRSILYSGNSSFSSTDLQPEFGVFESEGFSEERIKGGLENIKKFYNLAGYLNAEVSAEFDNMSDSSDLIIRVMINEQIPCRISEINFQSVNTPLNSQLKKLIKSGIGRIFSQTQLTSMQTDTAAQLLKDNYFSAVVQAPEVIFDASRTKVVLNYTVNEPYTYALVFEENEVFTEAKIKKELNLDGDNRLSSSPADDLNERIVRFYKREGYANISVKHRESLYSKDFVRRLTFEIKEGPRVRIKDITIDGSFSKPAKFYRNYILLHSGELVESKIYNSDDIDNGIKNLITDLQNQGFITAKVTGTRVDFDKLRENATIKMTIEEGPQTFIDKIVFTGIKKIQAPELEAAIGLKAGVPLQLSVLDESTSKIVELYRNRGFLDAQVSNQGKSIITYSTDNTKAVLTFEIIEGPLITVSGIAVEGNTFTKDFVIRRELQFETGDVLTPEKMSYSEERLQRLSLFTSVEIRTMDDDPREGRRVVLVRVVEHDPGKFLGGIGVSNDFELSLKGFTGVVYRNLFGSGRGVNARVEVNDKVLYKFLENDVNFGYTEPFIFNTHNTARINLTRSTKLFSVEHVIINNQFQENVFAVDSSQADLILERDLTRRLKLVYELYGIARTNKFEIYDKVGSTPLNIATTGPTFLYDRRTNLVGESDPFNPKKGDISTLSFEYSHPMMGSTGTVNYYKTIGSYTKYIPLGPLVWANEGKLGYLKNLSDLNNGAVPQIKSFYLGGRSTIRGFNPYSESIPLPSDIKDGIPTESHFALIKSEVRFPLFGNVGGALFYDGGAVRIPGVPTYQPALDWRHSAGVGLRYNTAVGPVSLDFGRKLNQDSTRSESDFKLDFSVGVF